MNTAGYEWAARVSALNEIEVAKAMEKGVVRVPMSVVGQEDVIQTAGGGTTGMEVTLEA